MALNHGLADTSVFIARETGRPIDESRVPRELSVSIITVAELRAGVLTATGAHVRARRLASLELALELSPVPIDDDVGRAWAQLRVALRECGRRMSLNDSWIAATAMTLQVPVITQDGDYSAVPGLEVVSV